MNRITASFCVAALGILFGASMPLKAQTITPNYQWAKKIGGTGAELLYDTKQDASGNIFVTGSFYSTADFDPSAATANLVSAGNTDMFVAKYDAAGNYLWAIRVGSTLADLGNTMVIDGSGNVIVMGSFIGTADFDPSAGTANLTAPGSSTSDIFIAKYSSSGAYMWAKRIGSNSGESGKSMIQDGSGNLYLTGLFASTCDFDPSAATVNITSFGVADAFIAKYDASGNYIFAKKMGGTGTDQGAALTFDNSGNIVVCGAFSGTADFDPSAATANLVAAGSTDMFLAKYTTSGAYMWAEKIGGTLAEVPYSLLNDASDNIYMSGYFNGTCDFDPTAATANLVSFGNTDIFLSKYNGSGGYVWAENMGGTIGDVGRNMLFDGNGNVLLTGSFGLTCDFDPSSSATYNLSTLGNTDIFLACYNMTTGAFVFANATGANSSDLGNCLMFGQSGNLLFSGYFASTVDFNFSSSGVNNLVSSGSTDNFFASYVLCPTITASLQSQTNVSCNGTGTGSATVTASGGTSFTYAWAPSGGTAATASNLTAGNYTCTITNQCGNSATVTVTITQPTAISSSLVSQSNNTCNGGTDGAATVSASGGTGTLTYAWTPSGGTAAAATGLSAGTYTCTITDANNCTATQTVNITQPAAINTSVSSQTNITCNGGTNGAATVSASGGTGALTYSWAPSGGTAASASGLSAGTYTCTITDASNCTATQTVNITEPALLSITPSGPSAICIGSSASLSANSTGGTGAVTFSWMPGSLSGTPVTVSPSTATTYTVTGTDANGCSSSATITVNVNSLPVISVTSTPASGIICSGSQAILTATGASSYSWTGGITNGVAFTPSSTNTYTVTGTSSSGCQSTATASITVNTCTQSSSLPCGQTYNQMLTNVSATNVPGAVSYRFSFYNNVTNALVAQRTQTSRTLALNTVTGIYYNTTYKWTVAVDMGSGFGAESNINCTVTFGVPTTTVPCGNTYTNVSTYTNVVTPGNIVGYRFTLYDNVTNAVYAQRTQTSNYIYFNTFSPMPQLGTTYKFTVALQYALSGGGTTFGPESNMNCTINFAAPQTTVPCNATYNKATGYTTCPAISGGTGYRFTFYQGSTVIAQVAQTSNYIYFNQVSGIANGQTYNWTVEVKYNSSSGPAYGPPSTQCPITFSASAFAPDPNRTNDESQPGEAIHGTTDMPSLFAYPNPTNDQLTLETTAPIKEVAIYSTEGKLIRTYGSDKQLSLGDIPTGTYFVIVRTETAILRTTIIKE